jgi:hypothetical protein
VAASAGAPVVRRTLGGALASEALTSSTSGEPLSTTELLNQVDRIVQLIEERVLREIERRSGRYRGGF